MDRVRELLAGDDEQRELLRALGGLLLGIGMVLVFFRRGATVFDPWGNGALFLVLFIPCVFLYGTGFVAARATGTTRPWHAVYMVFGTLLLPAALFQLLEWLGGSTDAPLNVAWIFLLTAVAGKVAALFAGVRYGLLIAGLATIVAWLAFWDEALDDGVFGDIGTLRGLLVVVALLLLAGAAGLWRWDRERALERAGELVTAAGVAAVAAGGISISAVAGAFTLITPVGEPIGEASLLWDLELLVVSLLLIGAGSWLGARGPAYVGTIGLLLFAYIVGLDLDDDSPAGKVLGWPLVLLVLGTAAFVASFFSGLRLDRLWPDSGDRPPPQPPAFPPAPGQS